LFGLDVFEHLNPNRIDAYVRRLAQIVTSGGYLFCNIPAFGRDQVFGTVFPYYIDGSEADAAAGRPFSRLHVDSHGYPLHGHLTWADASWWVERFVTAGFTREPEIEHALHAKYDTYMERITPARRAFFVFAKSPSSARQSTIVQRIATQPSRALEISDDEVQRRMIGMTQDVQPNQDGFGVKLLRFLWAGNGDYRSVCERAMTRPSRSNCPRPVVECGIECGHPCRQRV
jgi:hypothetical protein